ncbi:MAG: hypothetical protein ACTH7Q_12225 [Pseudoalteromonas sp.]
MNSQVITRLLAFAAGVLVTASYFILTDNKDLLSSQVVPQTTVQQPVETLQSPGQAVTLPSVKTVLTDDKPSEDEARSQAQLKAQVAELEQKLIQQQKQTQQYKAQLNRAYSEPSDLQQELQERFEQEPRNELWAYNVETAVNDFLITADLAMTPILESGECKTTVCQFELVTPEGEHDFDHTAWRELNDKLVKQPWWQQFKTSTSHSNDSHYRFVLSTEQ